MSAEQVMSGQPTAVTADLDVRGSVAGPSRLPVLPDVVLLDGTPTFAVTGGTGRFRSAHGTADITDNPGGTEQIAVRLTR